MAEDKSGEDKGGEAAPKKSKKMLFIIIGVVVLLLGGVGGFFAMSGGAEHSEEHAAETEAPKVYQRFKLDTFIVNLSDAKSFLKVTMLLSYDAELLAKQMTSTEGGEAHGGGGSGGGSAPAPDAFPAEISFKEPIVRDRILALLSSKTAENVLSVTGKRTLKEEIIDAVNEVLDLAEPVIVDVYFTEFIIQ